VQHMPGKPKEVDHQEYLVVDEMIILEWVVGKWDGNESIRLIWPRMGTSSGLYKMQ
jgi:hypothetical protein